MDETTVYRMTGWIKCADENWHFFTADENRPDTSACLVFNRPVDFDRIYRTLPQEEAMMVCPVCQQLLSEAKLKQSWRRRK